MMVKNRGAAQGWCIYHHKNTSAPETDFLSINSDDATVDASDRWNDTAPTSTFFTVGSHAMVNNDGDNILAMLFASVDGVSKVGYYDGSNSEQTITTGFQPRFLVIKRVDAGYAWFVLDTTRGWGAGGDSPVSYTHLTLPTKA